MPRYKLDPNLVRADVVAPVRIGSDCEANSYLWRSSLCVRSVRGDGFRSGENERVYHRRSVKPVLFE